MKSEYAQYLTQKQKSDFIEEKLLKIYKTKYNAVIYLDKTETNTNDIYFTLYLHDKYAFVKKNNLIYMEALFNDFYCEIKDMHNSQTCYRFDKEYAKYIYGKLRINDQDIASKYKQDYNNYRKTVREDKMQQQIQTLEQECDDSLLK